MSLPYYAVVMAGGGGTRFWPMSRHNRPKQLLPLLGPKTMIRQTVDRLLPVFDADHIAIVTHQDQAAAIRKELPMLDVQNTIPEPMGRDTAPCLGLAAVLLEHRAGGPVVFCAVPADQLIADPKKFHATLRNAYALAREGRPVTFGIKPTVPATGFGYIRRGAPIRAKKLKKAFELRQFCEKPDRATAQRFLRSGQYTWNSGMFVLRSDALLDAMKKFLPAHHAGLMRIKNFVGTGRQGQVIREEYKKFARISIDYGVMERWKGGVIIESPFTWSDVGTWGTVAQLRRQQATGKRQQNVTEGPVFTVDAHDNVVLTSPDHVIGIVGLKDLIVVHTPDATLICDLSRSEDVKKLVEQIKQKGLTQVL